MKQKFRLRHSNDIKRVRRFGKSFAHPLVVLIIYPNDLSYNRYGVITGRRIGNAVTRNKIRRRIRHYVYTISNKLTQGTDILIIARKPISSAKYENITFAINDLLNKAHLTEK